MEVAADAVVAKDAEIALLAQLDVPINVPVNEPENDPVLICVDDDTIPVGNIVGANEADTATLAEVATDDVPINNPLAGNSKLPLSLNVHVLFIVPFVLVCIYTAPSRNEERLAELTTFNWLPSNAPPMKNPWPTL